MEAGENSTALVLPLRGVTEAPSAGKDDEKRRRKRADSELRAPWRRQFCVAAAGEVECIASLMARELQHNVEEGTLALRGLVLRLYELSGVIISAASDENDTREAIEARLIGGPPFAVR